MVGFEKHEKEVKMLKKKYLAAFVAVTTVIGLGVAGIAPAQAAPIKIGVTVYDMSSFITQGKEEWWHSLVRITSNCFGIRPVEMYQLKLHKWNR